MAVKHRKQLTDEERAERRERDREYARQAVEQLRSSEGWKAWLTTRATFHRYSLGSGSGQPLKPYRAAGHSRQALI
jgi:hypothetical protein